MNKLVITTNQNTEEVTYVLNGVNIGTAHILYDDQRKTIVSLCDALKCNYESDYIDLNGERHTIYATCHE